MNLFLIAHVPESFAQRRADYGRTISLQPEVLLEERFDLLEEEPVQPSRPFTDNSATTEPVGPIDNERHSLHPLAVNCGQNDRGSGIEGEDTVIPQRSHQVQLGEQIERIRALFQPARKDGRAEIKTEIAVDHLLPVAKRQPPARQQQAHLVASVTQVESNLVRPQVLVTPMMRQQDNRSLNPRPIRSVAYHLIRQDKNALPHFDPSNMRYCCVQLLTMSERYCSESRQILCPASTAL